MVKFHNFMRQNLLIFILSITFIFSFGNLFGQTVMIELFDSEGNYPSTDPFQTVNDLGIQFTAWILGSEENTQNEQMYIDASRYYSESDKYVLYLLLDNFEPVPNAGNILRIEIEQIATGHTASLEFILDGPPIPMIMVFFDEDALYLREPPEAIFNSNEENLITTNADLINNFDPDEENVYRAENWAEDKYWQISFPTFGYDELRVYSQIRRQYEGNLPVHPRGPKTFITYYSIDEGQNWTPYGNIKQGDYYYHSLGNNEEWVYINFNLPQECAWRNNVLVRWRNDFDDSNNNGWSEIKDVKVTAYSIEEPPYELYTPNNLTYHLDGNNVQLSWDRPAPIIPLVYDNDLYTDSRSLLGNTMAIRMTPEKPAQVISISYFTKVFAENGNTFTAELYDWHSIEPAEDEMFSKTVSAENENWVYIDLTSEQIFVDEDFVVGFGSIDESVYLAYDEDLNHFRSWELDKQTGEWYSHNEAYLIRAEVIYQDEDVPVMLSGNRYGTPHRGNHKQRSLIGYNIYRDDQKINPELILEDSFIDYDLDSDVYDYYVTAVYAGDFESRASNNITVSMLSADSFTALPIKTELKGNYPNPFNPSTVISFNISEYDVVKLDIFNFRGQLVTNLINDYLNPGTYQASWNGTNNSGEKVGSGIYFYRMKTGAWSGTKKMLLIK